MSASESSIQQINKYTFSVKIQHHRYSSQLLNSIQQLAFIPKVTTNYQQNEFQIYASSIQTIREWLNNNTKKSKRMPYDIAVKMMECLFQQQKVLLDNGFSFYTFNTEDILIIDDCDFICVHSKHICLLQKAEMSTTSYFILNSPYSKENFCSPELLQCTHIPNNTIQSAPSFYYTFTSFVFFCFFGEKICHNIKKEEALLNTIIHTPLYWFFRKGLHVDPNKRKCFFIS